MSSKLRVMSYNYEQSIWGQGTASLKWSDPTAFRLKMSLKVLPERGKILEIGCGAGQFIRAIKKLRPELECYGYDISENAINRAKSYNDGVSYISEFRVLNSKFDVVLIYDVLEHVENPEDLIKQVKASFNSGGKFYLFVPCERDWMSLWNLLEKTGLKKDLTKKYAGHINYFTRHAVYDILKKYDFKITGKKYSEHFLGQLVGVVSFFLMDKFARKNNLEQINNETYFKNMKAGGLKKFINSLIYLESCFFRFIPSPNLHLFAQLTTYNPNHKDKP